MRVILRLRPVLKLLSLALALAPVSSLAEARRDTPPKLVVLISIDQFRQDYLYRFHEYFAEGGFRRLLAEGAVFNDCHYRHSLTTTAAGHATLATGVHAEIHGIIGNEWMEDPASGRRSESVEDPAYPLVGAAPRKFRSPNGALEAREGRSPRKLLAPTIGDQLKLRHGSRSRVVTVAQKDRAAILMGGQFADKVFWFDTNRLVSSTFYTQALPDWVSAFNEARPAEKYFGTTWDRLLSRDAYEKTQGADDAAGEDDAVGLGRSFPRVLNGGLGAPGPDYYDAFHLSPFINELLLDFAKRLITAENLGQHEAPDMLCLGISQVDYIGHSYGPDSHEVMDSVLRLDRGLADLIQFLDTKVGRDRYLLVLTADHGSTPLPERVNALGRGNLAARLDAKGVEASVEASLVGAFGPLPEGQRWSRRDGHGFRLSREALKSANIPLSKAAQVARDTLRSHPQLATAFTLEELLTLPFPSEGSSLAARMRRSAHAARSQDVLFVMKPNIVDKRPTGTSHGSPYNCDDHVPLLWFGHGVVHQENNDRVGVDDLAPTLCNELQVPRPPQNSGRLLLP